MAIILNNISKNFGDKEVLKGYSCTFPENKWTLLTGPSGCGKTTVFRILLGLEKADAGELENVPERYSVVFQENRLCEELTVRENIWLASDPQHYQEGLVEEALAQLGLSECMNQKVSELSGGMKRRIAIVRAALIPADAYLLDEPFYGLDQKTKESTIDFLITHLTGKTTILITHDQTAITYIERGDVAFVIRSVPLS